MNMLAILLLGIALSLDTFAVSLSLGFACERTTRSQKIRFLNVIGLFHFFMILIGWTVGEQVSRLISDYDHWIAFLLLAVVGGKMIKEGLSGEEEGLSCSDLLSLKNTMMLGVALSIDALITGFSLGLVKVSLMAGSQLSNILLSALIIGLSAFLISAAALVIGRRVSGRLGSRAGVFGGIILVLIGLKILCEHLI